MASIPPVSTVDDSRRSRREPGPWQQSSADEFFRQNVEAVLPATVHLPVRHWRPGMFFTGARDTELVGLTDGRFPATPRRRGSHPVFSLGRLPQNAGCAVCPCSSRRPYGRSEYLWIREGCTLLHTGYVMDRDSFIIKRLRFNIPAGIAYGLRFRGEVPDTCIESTGDRSRST